MTEAAILSFIVLVHVWATVIPLAGQCSLLIRGTLWLL